MRLYFDYRSIPELASLEPQERERVLRVSGRTFGKTRTFWVVDWLGILMSSVCPPRRGSRCGAGPSGCWCPFGW